MPKLNKREQKKVQQYQERRQRLINSGVNEDKVDGVIAQQDYSALPDGKKIRYLETLVRQAFEQFAKDVETLRENDGLIANAMDINMRSMSKCLEKVGVSLDDQRAIIEDVQKELVEEHQRMLEDQKRQEEDKETKKMEEVLSKEASPSDSGDPEVPEEATVFGG